jgi:hypothetical protein
MCFSSKFIFLTVLDYPNILFIYSKLIFDYLRNFFNMDPFFKKNCHFVLLKKKEKKEERFVNDLLKKRLVFFFF